MKLSSWTIYILAISLSVCVLSFALFHYAIPSWTEAGYYREYKDKLEQEANKKSAALKRVKVAEDAVQQKTDLWNAYVATRTPTNDLSRGGINLAVNPYQLSVDTQKYRNSVQRAVNAQVKRGGVKVLAGPYVPGPADTSNVSGLLAEYYHYPTIGFPIVIFNLGTVTVQGSFKQIMDNVRAYKNMPNYLAVTDGLRLNGTSPILTGTYQLTVVGYIRGNRIFGSVPEAAATTAGSGFPGGGGPPGGGGFAGPPRAAGGAGGAPAGGAPARRGTKGGSQSTDE